MKNKPYDSLFVDKAADEIEERKMLSPYCSGLYPFVGICPHCHYDHGTLDFQWQQLRKAVSEFERTRCTCGVSTTLGMVHRADAPCFHFSEKESFRCKAQIHMDPPQDCDWPLCGCDPHAESVITALQEQGTSLVPSNAIVPRSAADALVIECLRAEIAALVHQRDEAIDKLAHSERKFNELVRVVAEEQWDKVKNANI